MKKLTLSLAAVVAMSTFAMAGGEIVEPEVTSVAQVVSAENGFYVGLGYSYLDANGNHDGDEFTMYDSGYVLLGGYQFNKNFAIEARYNSTIGDITIGEDGDTEDSDATLSNAAIYLKPIYPIDNFKLYALLGYGISTFDFKDDEKYTDQGFQWGVGASYEVADNISVFVDYTQLFDGINYDNTATDIEYDAVNIGLTYKF